MTCCVMRLKSPSGFLIPAEEKELLVRSSLPLLSDNPFPGFRCASNFPAFAFVGLLISLGRYGKPMTNCLKIKFDTEKFVDAEAFSLDCLLGEEGVSG